MNTTENAMNVYDAIMKAADQIERHPEGFNVNATSVPTGPSCGTPGCALGWISYFAKIPSRSYFGDEISELLAIKSDTQFYDRMDVLCGERPCTNNWTAWARDASLCARTMRLYAAKYHAPAVPKRTDAELVSDLMAKVTSSERIAEDA